MKQYKVMLNGKGIKFLAQPEVAVSIAVGVKGGNFQHVARIAKGSRQSENSQKVRLV